MNEITEAEAIARAMSGGIVWDDELPESMRGFGVPSLWRIPLAGQPLPLPVISCDCCDFRSTDPDDFADLGGDRQFGGVLTAYPCQCHACAHTPPGLR